MALRLSFDWLLAGSLIALIFNLAILGLSSFMVIFLGKKIDAFLIFTTLLLTFVIHSALVHADVSAAVFVASNLGLLFIFNGFLSTVLREDAAKALRMLFRVATISALVSALQMIGLLTFTTAITPETPILSGLRYGGLLAWPQISCLLFCLAELISLDSKFQPYMPKSRLARVTSRVLLAIGMLATGSVTAVLGLCIALAWMYRDIFSSLGSWIRYSPIATLILAGFALSPTGQRFITDTFQLEISANQTTSTNSFDWRVLQWIRTLKLTLDHPLFGTGSASAVNNSDLQGLLPHNDYLRVAFEYGYLGLAIVLALASYVFVKTSRNADIGGRGAEIPILILIAVTAFGENLFDQGMIYLTVGIALSLLPALGSSSQSKIALLVP